VRTVAKPSDRRRGSLYEPIPYVLLRVPSLSLDDYRRVKDLTRVVMDPQGPNLAELRSSKLREAISIASPSFLRSLDERNHRHFADLTSKLLRYLIRMSSRPVPFGLFAGVALMAVGENTDVRMGSSPADQCARPDMEWLLRFVLGLEAQIEIRRELRLCADCKVFICAGRAMLPEALELPPYMPASAGVSIRATDAVLAALRAAKNYVPYSSLVRQLSTGLRGSIDQVEGLITSLWRHSFIKTDLRPPFTIDDPARYVLRRLAGIDAAREVAATLENILEGLESHAPTARNQRKNPCRVADIAPEESLGRSTEHIAPAIQIDTTAPLDGAQISKTVVEEAARAAELLLRMTTYPNGLPHIAAFRQHFIRRYGNDRDVPLIELLDPNFGLGAQWRAAIADLNKTTAVTGVDVEDERSGILLDLASRALRDRTLALELTPDLLAALETWRPSPATAPASLDISVLVAASGPDDIDAGRFQIVVGPDAGACGAGRFIGRFAGLLGRRGNDVVQMVARGEEAIAPDVLSAELICVPRRFRLTNVTIRPPARRYEIVLDTTPGVDEAHVIRADELVVGVRDDRFYVRSLPRDLDVHIRFGHMLAPHHLSYVGRFLAEVCQDGLPWFHMFYWGPAEIFPYLPRVQVGRIVLRPAQWRVLPGELSGSQPLRDKPGFHESLVRYRARLGMPRYVYLGSSSERLLLDLEDNEQAAELCSQLERCDDPHGIVLQEVIPAIEQAWLQGPNGRYASEIIISLIRRPEHPRSAANSGPPPAVTARPINPRRQANLQRLRPPGSEWLYLKIYCGRDFQNEILLHRLQEFTDKAISTGTVADWFFVRYADPDDHLRIRFQGVPERILGELMPSLSAWASSLIADELCLRFSYETYERELERYGGPEGMAVSENIFCADSRAAVLLVGLLHSRAEKLDAILLSALSADDLLSSLGASEDIRLRVYGTLAPDQEGRDEFRRHKKFLSQAFQNENLVVPQEIEGLASLLEARRRKLAPLGRRLTGLSQSGRLTREPWELYASFVHLHFNRLLGVKPKLEQPVCGMLRRLLRGIAARRMEMQTGKHHNSD